VKRFFARHETILLLLVVAEIICFNTLGRRFASGDNITNIVRHSVEIGLLALVMTPIIFTGGIDLSVGSTLGLCAVLFGKLWRDGGLPPAVAGVLAILIGTVCGLFNGLLITQLRLPPLIVTLGTFSLFRGLAEAITQGVDAFTKFPESFLLLGTGQILGLPSQSWILAIIAIAIWLLVHRANYGRAFRFIGFSAEGARFAAIPVERRLLLVYTMAGMVAGIAALTYSARLGTAKADAGMGYELLAITAVVLGGTSIFGGVGSVHGTLLGVAALAILNNGLSRIPSIMNMASELSGVLTGGLLIVALALATLPKHLAAWRLRRQSSSPV
jgi:ribose/xylose/arabinose/galactoside ABC-type transport system permease subunit